MTNTVQTLTADNLAVIQKSGRDFCKADTDRAFALHNFMRVIGDAPTYDAWMTARAALVAGYRETKPNANDDAANTWFSRYVGALRAYVNEQGYSMSFPEKPKATTPEAEKKAAQRANPFDGKTRDDIQATIATLTGSDMDTAKAKVKALEALDKLNKAEVKAREQAEADKLKPRREVVQAVVKKAPAHVLALMEAIIDMTADNASDESKIRAWAILEAIAPKVKQAPAKIKRAA